MGLLVPGLSSLAPRRDRRDLYVLLWLAVPLAFFSAAGSKLPGYILPCLPPLALLLGRAAHRLAAAPATPELLLVRRVAGLLTLAMGAVVAAVPLALGQQGDALWRLTLPLAAWSLLIGWLVSRRLGPDPAGALRLLRVGAAGLLVLLALAAPPLLEARESGRVLFAPARGREVLAWNAWRTAWMAGYFYNDGRVRPVPGLPEVAAAARVGPVLVLCGPAERRALQRAPGLMVRVLASGPRNNALLEVTSPS
jgi:4-amino-4-deoxy-L-arabinose transferase-like glycosyltransferase